MRLVGREEIVGLARNAAARSDAFLTDGEARLMLGTVPTEVSSEAQRSRGATGVVAHLAHVLARRSGALEWYAAFGDGPDELSTLAALGSVRDAAERVAATASSASAAHLLLALAGASASTPLKPNVAWPYAHIACNLALCCSVAELSSLLEAMLHAAGPGRALWCCDRALQTRFMVRRSGTTFRCHHPLLHAALVQRCAKDGFDLA
ncbi:MAG: hypothetical protein EXS14_06980 [Planctomycetes bacterium]|nr:hypothetical protein [Planctomycetota bacterium]